MTDDDIRLFNELMSTQPGEQIEGLASRYPDVFEKPRLQEPTDPLKMRERIADSERKRKEQEEAEFQAKYGQKTIVDMARPEFIPDDITAAIKAIGTLGSGAGAGIKGMIGEAVGMDPEAIMQRNIYLPDFLTKDRATLTPEEERERAFYGRYIDKSLEGFKTVGDALESPMRAYEESKLDALMFMPGTRNISMIDDVIEMGIRGARDVAPVVRPAIKSATKAATEAGTKAIETVQETLATPPVGAISLDTLGFSSRLSEGVDKLQDKGTGPQFLAQLSKMKGVPLAEIKVTGLDEYLKNTPKVTKQEVQDYLETNRLQLIEDERIAGAGRIDSEVVQYLPQQFDWLGKEDLAEEFEDKAHLRNHLIRTLDRHFDDLEAEADNTGSFYARDSSTGDLRYIPASKRFEWREAEIDKIDNELGDFPEFNGATNFEGDYQIPGGQNYREILYKLPDDKVEGVFRPPDGHFPNAENTFGSIRATDREIDGTPTLFAEEIQSDWAIAGAKGGYGPQPMPDVDAETLRTTPDIQYRLSPDQKVFLEDLAIENDIAYFSPKSEERTKEIQRLQKKYDDWKATEKIKGSVPDNPFRGNWYKPVINNFLVKAAQEGKGGIGFPVGEIVKDRYNLANVVDRIESSTDKTIYPTPLRGGPFKNVTIDLKPALAGANEKQMRLRVDKDGLVRGVNAEQYNRFIGKPLTEVVGKGVSEKILSNDSQVMTDLDLKIGGEGKDKLYDDMLPKHLNEIGKRYGVQLEKRTIPFGEGKKKESEVYFMPITEEMRNDILSEGLPMFKQGGHVKMAKGGPIKSALEGVGKAAAEVKKTGKLTRLQKELRERGGEKQAQRLERAADEIPGLERLFHSRGLIEAFQGSEGFPYQGVVTMRPGDYKNFSQPLEVDLSEGRQGISPYSVQNIEDLRELIRRGRPFTSVPYLQLDKKGPLTIVSGHEGRHRTRAMEAEDIPATLVQVLPRHALKFKDLRNPSPSEWRQKLSEAMGPEGLVLPEGGMKLNPKFARASELAKKASEERDWNKFGALDRELSRYHKEDKVKLPDLEMLTEFPEVYQKGGAVKSMVSNTHIAPSDVVERTQLKKKGGLACLSK
jgi:hypothetical protein